MYLVYVTDVPWSLCVSVITPSRRTKADKYLDHHTHTVNCPLSRTTLVSRYQKGKANLDFTEARDSEWQWHQLGHMQVCTSLPADNHASTPSLSFYWLNDLPATQPTESKHWRHHQQGQNPPVLNRACQLMQVVVYNGHPFVVLLLLLVVVVAVCVCMSLWIGFWQFTVYFIHTVTMPASRSSLPLCQTHGLLTRLTFCIKHILYIAKTFVQTLY